MPCSPRMVSCRRDCLHRALVMRFYEADDAWRARAQAVGLDDTDPARQTDLAMWRDSDPRPNLRDFMGQYPYGNDGESPPPEYADSA